jgi:LysM repeat protein
VKFFEGKFRRAKLKNKQPSNPGRNCAKLMNNPNPFVPKGSLLELQGRRRSRLKLAVFCVLAVSITGLVAGLIQGCKREKPDTDLNPPPMDTNAMETPDTNMPPMNEVSNPPVSVPPMEASNTPAVVPAPVAPAPAPVPAASEYVVVKGDTLGKIAKKNGVSLKALEDANPGVVPTKLKIGQKLALPAGSGASAEAAAPAAGADMGTTSYTVKSGDTLGTIAKRNGTTVKAIETANGLTSTKIKVGQKLKIPSKAEAAPAAPAPALPPVSTPAPTTAAPAPGQ